MTAEYYDTLKFKRKIELEYDNKLITREVFLRQMLTVIKCLESEDKIYALNIRKTYGLEK